jgi:small subunit ribosomal protein S7
MSRRISIKKKFLGKDLRYNSFLLNMFINYILKAGKKRLARKIFYNTLKEIKKRKPEEDPILIIEKAVRNAGPKLELRVVIVKDSLRKIAIPVNKLRSIKIAVSWIINCSKKQSDRGQSSKLASELIDTSKGLGETIKKRKHLYKMVQASKSFTESKH